MTHETNTDRQGGTNVSEYSEQEIAKAPLVGRLEQRADQLDRSVVTDRNTAKEMFDAIDGEGITPDDPADIAAGIDAQADRDEEVAALLREAIAALRTASQGECPDCEGNVFFRCPAHESKPATPASASEAVPVAKLYRDGYWTHAADKDPFDRYGPNRNAASLEVYIHPAPASGEPAYDRELCADIMSQFYNALMAGELDWAGRYTGPCIDEQINLLRTADNRDAAGVRTVDWKARAERAEEVLKHLASGERSIAEIDAILNGHTGKEI